MDLSAFDLKGKVALITGGAHGIGFSIAVGMACLRRDCLLQLLQRGQPGKRHGRLQRGWRGRPWLCGRRDR